MPQARAATPADPRCDRYREVGLSALVAWMVAGSLACGASHHPATPAELGLAVSSDVMMDVIGTPGPIRFERVVAADWAVERSGLINLDHPTAQAAGLDDGVERIQLYFYVLEHPRFGRWIVDSGVEVGFLEDTNERIGALVRAAMKTDALEVRTTTARWLRERGGQLDGVFLTHIHLDHIMGLPDLAPHTPVYTGPGEVRASAFLNLFLRGTTDRLLAGKGPLREWQFEPDPAGRFDGVIDVFGDGSLFALHVPGHSPGSTAFVVRSTRGPRLLVGDASHTAWGWRNDVEPGTFSLDGPRSATSLKGLRRLALEVSDLDVHLGHLALGGSSLAGR